MHSSDIVEPLALQTAFAINGNKNIPAQNASGTETSSINLGFLPITSEPLDDGGLPPERTDFNGMFYLSTDQRVYLQNGGFITYSDAVASKIGGYPKGAILGYLDSNNNFSFVISLVENNQNTNFNTNPSYINNTYWAYCNDRNINKARSISLTGAITGSANYNLANTDSISIATTGKSKTVSLTGAVTGSATLNTGNTSAVTIATTGKQKTITLSGDVTGSAVLDTGNTNTVNIVTSGVGKTKTLTLTGAVDGSATLNTGDSDTVTLATTGKQKTLNISGAVDGSAILNTGNTNAINVLTTGKSKTVSLTGAVTGSATLNTGNTDNVSITTTGKTKTISLTGDITGSAILNTGNTDNVSITTTTTGKSKTVSLTGAITGSATLNTGNTDSVSITTVANTVADINLSNLTSTGENHFANTALTNLTSGLSNTICTTAPTTVSTATSATPAVVVENYVNETSWYCVWSDGRLEQGGRYESNATGNTDVTISLLKNFKNINYSPFINGINNSSASSNIMVVHFGARDLTTSSFKVKISGTLQNIVWYAVGQKA